MLNLKRIAALCFYAVLAITTPAQAFTHTLGGGNATSESCTVTNLGNADTIGSLRFALKQSNCRIVFTTAGEIFLNTPVLDVIGNNLTIDGSSAPFPGITLVGRTLRILGKNNIIIRDIRFRNSDFDSIQIGAGSRDILIEHITSIWATDEGISVADGAKDIVVQDSILHGDKAFLIRAGAHRVSVRRNYFWANQRSVQAKEGHLAPVQDVTVDFVNNVVANWIHHGTLCWMGAWCNIAHNYYSGERNTKGVDINQGGASPLARAWTYGNVDVHGVDWNSSGTEFWLAGINGPLIARPTFKAAVSTPLPVCQMLTVVLANAGARPRHQIDNDIIHYATAYGPLPAMCD